MKFTTTLESVGSNKSKTTIKLSMSNAVARKFTANFLNSIDKELIVEFEDPQMEMEIENSSTGRGLVATVNHNGVVETVKQQEIGDEQDEQEDDQEDEFDEPGRNFDGKVLVVKIDDSLGILFEYIFRIKDGYAWLPDLFTDGVFERTADKAEILQKIGSAPIDDGGPVRYLIDELIGAFGGELRDIQTEDAETDFEALDDPDEVSFNDDDQPADADPVESEIVIDKEAIEEYILNEKPVFEAIPYNFPEMIRRKREEDITWMDLASESNITKGQLQTAWQKYKELVAEQMRTQRVA